MSRFAEPQDAAFRALNDSLSFDWRLGPYDVQQSRAHASMLAAQGIISEAERDELHSALDQVERELGEGSFPFADGDEDPESGGPDAGGEPGGEEVDRTGGRPGTP